MKKLICLLGFLLLLSLTIGCRRSQADRYQRYVEDVSDSTFEYITPKEDSVNADGESVNNEDADWADDDGLVAIPDIPKERSVNMNANDYDAMKEFSGRGGE